MEKLIRTLHKIAKAHGACHDVCRIGTVQFTIPRHREINELTAKAIIQTAKGACR